MCRIPTRSSTRRAGFSTAVCAGAAAGPLRRPRATRRAVPPARNACSAAFRTQPAPGLLPSAAHSRQRVHAVQVDRTDTLAGLALKYNSTVGRPGAGTPWQKERHAAGVMCRTSLRTMHGPGRALGPGMHPRQQQHLSAPRPPAHRVAPSSFRSLAPASRATPGRRSPTSSAPTGWPRTRPCTPGRMCTSRPCPTGERPHCTAARPLTWDGAAVLWSRKWANLPHSRLGIPSNLPEPLRQMHPPAGSGTTRSSSWRGCFRGSALATAARKTQRTSPQPVRSVLTGMVHGRGCLIRHNPSKRSSFSFAPRPPTPAGNGAANAGARHGAISGGPGGAELIWLPRAPAAAPGALGWGAAGESLRRRHRSSEGCNVSSSSSSGGSGMPGTAPGLASSAADAGQQAHRCGGSRCTGAAAPTPGAPKGGAAAGASALRGPQGFRPASCAASGRTPPPIKRVMSNPVLSLGAAMEAIAAAGSLGSFGEASELLLAVEPCCRPVLPDDPTGKSVPPQARRIGGGSSASSGGSCGSGSSPSGKKGLSMWAGCGGGSPTTRAAVKKGPCEKRD
jgi:hypothetical protein